MLPKIGQAGLKPRRLTKDWKGQNLQQLFLVFSLISCYFKYSFLAYICDGFLCIYYVFCNILKISNPRILFVAIGFQGSFLSCCIFVSQTNKFFFLNQAVNFSRNNDQQLHLKSGGARKVDQKLRAIATQSGGREFSSQCPTN